MLRLQRRIWPLGRHPGGLAWEVAMDQLGEDILLWRQDGEVLAWVGRYGQGEATAEVDPAHPAAAAWVASVVAERRHFLQVADGQRALAGELERAGFTRDPQERWRGLWLDLRAAAPTPPPGYSIRSVAPAELEQRVAVHRAAWLPAALPYAAGHRPEFAADATSRFTAEHYARVRQLSIYDGSLDLVAVAPDGTFAGCCLAWLDAGLQVAEIEPLGVVPEHRRRGLAGALCLEVAARCAERGAGQVFINTGPSTPYPAPAGAYLKAGFRVVDRGWVYRPPER